MKMTLFDGCIGFGINLDGIRLPDGDIEIKKKVLHGIIEAMDNSEDLDFLLKDFCTMLEPVLFESNICSMCGEYSEYGEYNIPTDCID